MSANLKVVSTTTDPMVDIANSIQKGTWGNVEKDVDLLQFMKMVIPNEYIINPDKSLQVRGTTLNYDFIDRQVMKVKITGDKSGLKMSVLVYFSEEVEYEGTVFPDNSYAILDRNHGAVIKVRCGITVSDCYVVNFDDDLDSKLSNIRALGNVLNLVFVESQCTTVDNLKTEYHQLMDENVAKGLDAKLTDIENVIFLKRYSIINSASLRNFSSSHITGGRKKPVKMWTEPELIIEKANVENRHKGWLVMYPRTCASWKGEPSGQATWDALNELNDKIVFIFHAKTMSQTEKKYHDQIRNHFDRWAERYDLEVKIIFLQSK